MWAARRRHLLGGSCVDAAWAGWAMTHSFVLLPKQILELVSKRISCPFLPLHHQDITGSSADLSDASKRRSWLFLETCKAESGSYKLKITYYAFWGFLFFWCAGVRKFAWLLLPWSLWISAPHENLLDGYLWIAVRHCWHGNKFFLFCLSNALFGQSFNSFERFNLRQDEHLLLSISQVPCWDLSALLALNRCHWHLTQAPTKDPWGQKDPEACGQEVSPGDKFFFKTN